MGMQPQTQVVPLRFPVEVYSGITPPPALLNALATRTNAIPSTAPQEAPAIPPRPGAAASTPAIDPLYPPQIGTANADTMGEAPPSYEDAMADDIGPLDGRREYSGVANETSPSEIGDEKGKNAAPGYVARENGGGRSGAGSGSFTA